MNHPADCPAPHSRPDHSAICYLAYPTSLTLRAANAIQTYLTVRELRLLCPDLLVIVPRFLREPSAFGEVGAVHLPRIPIGKLSRFHRSAGWYYLERSLFAWMVAVVLLFRRLFRGQRYRLLYVREVICAYWMATALRPLTGARVVYEAHELESRNPSRARGRPWQAVLRRLDRTLLRRADLVVSLTATFAREMREQGWRPAGPIAILPDAYDEALYQPMEQEQSRQVLRISPEIQAIVYSGLTFSYRGLEVLVQALARLAPRWPHLRLYLVGGRPQEIAALLGHAQARGVEERVIFTGAVAREQVPFYLAAADALVIPGTVSGPSASPLKMFEYMAMDRPIVSVDIPALREVLDDRSAYFFPPQDSAALALALEEVLGRPDQARTRAEQARRRSATYTYRRRAERLLDIVKHVDNPSKI